MAPTYAEIALHALDFDPDNPRMPESLDASDLSAVLAFMLEDAGLLDLMASIAKQGFFPGEPLLVSPSSPGRWLVVEGNRRFASCLLLAEPERAPTKARAVNTLSEEVEVELSAIPCLQFETRDAILNHLGYRHVTGIKEWDPLAKARFLKQRYELEQGSPEERFKSLAKSIGSRSDYVGRLLTAYGLFARIDEEAMEGAEEAAQDFSLITSLLAYSAVPEYLGLASSADNEMRDLDQDRLAFLTRFTFVPGSDHRTGLGESRNIRALADVLVNERAREALEAGLPLAAASKLVGSGTDAIRSLLAGAGENLELAHGQLEDTDLDNSIMDSIEQVKQSAERLHERAQQQGLASHAG